MRNFIIVLILLFSVTAMASDAGDTKDVGPATTITKVEVAVPNALDPAKEETKAVEGPVEGTQVEVEIPPAPEMAQTVVQAIKSKNWAVVIGGVLMLFVFIINTFVIKKLPKAYVPWVTAAAGIATYVSLNMYAGMPWDEAIAQGFTAGASAVGLWEMLGKRVLPKKVQ